MASCKHEWICIEQIGKVKTLQCIKCSKTKVVIE